MHATAAHLVNRIVTTTARALWSQPVTGLDGATTANLRLARYLANKRNARKVQRAVAKWRKKARRRNGSVAFVATALRDIGVPVPQDESIDGLAISHITLALSCYLEDRLGWQRVAEPTELSPGDVVFTEDAICCPGLPAHVFVFLGWSDRARLIAHISDEHGNRHARPLRSAVSRPAMSHAHSHASSSDSPFAYALRQPRGEHRCAAAARQSAWQPAADSNSIYHVA
jgi:hypothetical protein